ncbi:histidine phosphatase family protein [Paenibacillus sp. ACRRX]|uniref:histidine phosphatase family protein n=1 Tax=Paenibacillus sp. ACRRX TaxID=2918206 RepID=UPI001EF56341|nr:histidine phosphatase family protein [Paenibacillus sp. ACRRX]MCG7407204.1 histidine phosphatase family protein [Paenibacillus sp. ACRRX]
MTRFGIIRHGSTPWNKEGRAQGNSDISLDEAGERDAHLLGERLCLETWDLIVSSSLLRAKQTAEIIQGKFGSIPLLLDDRLREASGGQIEGTTEAERVAKWGLKWWEIDLGMESKESVVARGMSAFEVLLREHYGKNVLVVSHGAFIKHMLNEIVPHPDRDGPLDNTSLTCVVHAEKGWSCELHNCTQHLTSTNL